MYRLTKSRRFFNDKKRMVGGRQQAGVTLIEVLVSILVLSVGLLGMMGLQAGAMRFEHGAWVRAAVSAAVADFSDGIRMIHNSANIKEDCIAGVCTFEYGPSLFESIRSYDEELEATKNAAYFVTNPNCDSSNCTNEEFISFQRASWRRGINASFPGGVGFIEHARPGKAREEMNQFFTLTIAWADKSLVKSDGSVDTVPSCKGTEVGAAARNCCPDAIKASAGVRCTRVVVLP